MSKRLRPNEDREQIATLKQSYPGYDASKWIVEALNINNQSCSDDAIGISNLLYCALDALKAPATRQGGAR
jgi:hypothetical protein